MLEIRVGAWIISAPQKTFFELILNGMLYILLPLVGTLIYFALTPLNMICVMLEP